MTSGLVLNGSFEDGYDGINFGLTTSALTPHSGNKQNVILITDEDRDIYNAGLGFADVFTVLRGRSALLNAAVNTTLRYPTNQVALGVASDGTAYVADGSGGFTTASGGTASASTTKTDYVDLAWATGGAAWDLQQLRAGGLTAQSFTAAFIDLKIQEIDEQPGYAVPVPLAAWAGMALIGGMGLGRLVRRAR